MTGEEETIDWMGGRRHCDEYITDFDQPDCLRWFLLVKRMPAGDRNLTEKMAGDPKLFATYNGKPVRVLVASRMGDVGITEDLDSDRGYSLRVAVEDLKDFSGENKWKKNQKSGTGK